MYSEAVLDHFKNPRNSGELADASASAEVTNPVCGDILLLAVRVEGGRIGEARFKARGCVTAIACASLLTELLTGRAISQARETTAEQISEALGGLPAATFHGAQLARDAMEAVLEKIA